jgi:hypothetical protein
MSISGRRRPGAFDAEVAKIVDQAERVVIVVRPGAAPRREGATLTNWRWLSFTPGQHRRATESATRTHYLADAGCTTLCGAPLKRVERVEGVPDANCRACRRLRGQTPW